ncbi:hypothetical protein A1Q1_04592 [Trichosporon asahii var. asahii CBS 2479]|uniref:HCNGP-like protein n=1 Tax=Trichosporon asahii var. asahii (strain ATCC 90039 / CBS 2479 / JCM 2466 / KCTC 7840 / NBRC 103889/ NCYC 2677 / UAMH 7654) TaxID=1186058 RepID=J5TRM1_TRIAS|nr:hypothetical protein A1Q1_04592 [Trichosporon asahii var. asahii CBS 2479]EJT52381.1 hypothetical protein A1Q1_04592 [Trichosporon asahii var. asahii CBS 2479]
MDPDVVFRTVTQPAPMPEANWGLSPAEDPEKADEVLKAKVARFLQLKKQGQHVNTSLLRSSSFANPTIYAKLVEFVDIDERASAFSRGGWLTRRGLEETKKDHGPKVLLRRQDEMAEAARPQYHPNVALPAFAQIQRGTAFLSSAPSSSPCAMTPASGDGTVAALTPTAGFPFAYGRPVVNPILCIDASDIRLAYRASFLALPPF